MAVQVHQFHPTVSYGDAIGNYVLGLQQLLRNMGYRSEVFCEHVPLHFEGHARQIAQHADYSSPANLLLLHFSLNYSPAVVAWLEQIPDRKVLIYHNITPHTYFDGISPVHREAALRGRQQLDDLRELVDVGWGVSEFNCRELAARGWTRLGVLPIVFEPRRYAVRPDRNVLRRWQSGANVLFVGRISPNKRLEDLILTFYHLKRFVRPDARLFLVGSAQGLEPYLQFLQALVDRLDVSDAFFTGHVSTAQLAAYYQCASVYLSMSEHEGLGVPLLECMHFGVPIVAYKATAVPETLEDSGILVTAKDHAAVAELIGLLIEDVDLRSRIVARQRGRLQDLLSERVEERLRELLHSLSV